MSDPTAQEPTMEEILASIRRIISEDDTPAAAADPAPAAKAEDDEIEPAAPPAPPAAQPTPPVHLAAVTPAPRFEEEDDDDDVLDLTEAVPTPAETHGDLDVFDAEPAPKAPEPKAPEPKAPERRPAPAAVQPAPKYEEPSHKAPFGGMDMDDDRLISGGTEDKAASHFGKLSQSVAMPAPGRNLEDVVTELLKPLLKDWLDQHLPGIVEEKVQAEVERISRRRV